METVRRLLPNEITPGAFSSRRFKFTISPARSNLKSMTHTHQIREILETYFAAVDSQKADNPEDLASAMAALETVSQNPDPTLPGRLRHFLESRSYRKAYAELGGSR